MVVVYFSIGVVRFEKQERQQESVTAAVFRNSTARNLS